MIRLVPLRPEMPTSGDEAERESRLRSINAQLRRGRSVVDSVFDDVYPLEMRAVSSSFWTPVSVAVRAADLLVHGKADRILDVGSGVGKFCIVGGASTAAAFVGVEHRSYFVSVAEEARRRVGVPSAEFIQGSFKDVDVKDFNGIYFFNPFEENLWCADTQLDHTVELSEARFHADIEAAKSMLERAHVGTRVVTYHGLGGDMPPSYELVLSEPIRTDKLDLWIKRDGQRSICSSTQREISVAPSTE